MVMDTIETKEIGEPVENPKPGQEPMAVDAREAARLCGIGRTSWLTRYHAGQTPEPVRLGRRVLWRVRELAAWLDAGCPPRHNWQWPSSSRAGRVAL